LDDDSEVTGSWWSSSDNTSGESGTWSVGDDEPMTKIAVLYESDDVSTGEW
jgi:hypothetical protein